jgi:hypothetical protein
MDESRGEKGKGKEGSRIEEIGGNREQMGRRGGRGAEETKWEQRAEERLGGRGSELIKQRREGS